jgi:hypothetical protein
MFSSMYHRQRPSESEVIYHDIWKKKKEEKKGRDI